MSSAALARHEAGALLLNGDLASVLVAVLPTPASRARVAAVNRHCAATVQSHHDCAARFILKRFRRYKLSPYAYQYITLLGETVGVRLRRFTPRGVPIMSSEGVLQSTKLYDWSYAADVQRAQHRAAATSLVPKHGDAAKAWARRTTLDEGEDGGTCTEAFALLPLDEPLIMVWLREPNWDYDKLGFDVGVFSLLNAINRGEHVEDEHGEALRKWEDTHGSLNGFPSAPLCRANFAAWWGIEAPGATDEDQPVEEDELLRKLNTALGTNFNDVDNLWLPAADRPHAPELFAALRDPLDKQ